jgi:hypothetical protein
MCDLHVRAHRYSSIDVMSIARMAALRIRLSVESRVPLQSRSHIIQQSDAPAQITTQQLRTDDAGAAMDDARMRMHMTLSELSFGGSDTTTDQRQRYTSTPVGDAGPGEVGTRARMTNSTAIQPNYSI